MTHAAKQSSDKVNDEPEKKACSCIYIFDTSKNVSWSSRKASTRIQSDIDGFL
jgi:hypothetical protein